jgi:hypothetical protein
MLRRSMSALAPSLRLHLDDVLGDLRHARRSGDLGRLALLAYCEVRRWARAAGEEEIAAHSSQLVMGGTCGSRAEFLLQMDGLIGELEGARERMR